MILADFADDHPVLMIFYAIMAIVWLVFPFFVMRHLWKIHHNLKNLLIAVVRLLPPKEPPNPN